MAFTCVRVTDRKDREAMKDEKNLTYLSIMYYTAAALFLLTAVFSALSRSWAMAGVWLSLGAVLFSYRFLTAKKIQ